MKPTDPKYVSENESLTNIDQAEFEQFRSILERNSGIHLPANKQYLVATRLRKLMHEHNFGTLRQLLSSLQSGASSSLRNQVVEAMTTNETFWFRDNYPFSYLGGHLLPQHNASRPGSRLRIWCTACSSGQEPYSLAMIADEYARSVGKTASMVEIMATDISDAMLERSKQGLYDQLELTRGMSNTRLERYFDNRGDGRWQVKSALRNSVSYRRLNLKDSYTNFGKFDVIFCRNVLIYFSAELKNDILRRLHQQLQPGGILFLGASEGLGGCTDIYEMVQCNPGIAYRSVRK